MIEAGCVRVLDNLSQRKKWGDADLEENIETLSEALRENIAEMSSFDMYKAEVTSGNLDWTPVHRSEKFWRENIARFADNDNEVLGVLVHLLRTSQTPLVLSVACHDVGEFIRFHPRGRQYVVVVVFVLLLLPQWWCESSHCAVCPESSLHSAPRCRS